MPDTATVQRAIALMQRSRQNRFYFFEKLNDPAWIEPLRDQGFFKETPEPEGSVDGLMVPAWPESQYLARMADVAPDLVADVLLGVPDTENFRVRWDIARAAKSFGLPAALRVAEREQRWIERHSSLGPGYPEAITALALHLATLGAGAEALALARALLAVVETDDDGPLARAFATRVDQWEYERLLVVTVPSLAELVGLGAIELVADLLEASIELDRVSKKPYDASDVWRPAIERNPQNYGFDVRDALVSATRDAAMAWSGEDPERVATVAKMLRDREWVVFRRIALRVFAKKCQVAPELAINAALDEVDFFDGSVFHEFTDLSAAVFGLMSDAQRDEWLALLDEGPTWPPRVAAERAAEGVTDEWYERYVRTWRRSRLQLVEDDLPAMERDELGALIAELGRDAHPGFLNWYESWTGPTSPLDAGRVAEMSAAQIIEYARGWTPEQAFAAPSPEGLSRILTKHVAANPGEFTDLTATGAFEGLDPTYVRAVLAGWEEALREDKESALDWEQVLGVIELVVEGPAFTRPAVIDDYHARDWDPDWGWGRKDAARLILRALETNTIDPALADRTWEQLSVLSWDNEPTPAYEAQYGGTNMDPLTLSLNTVRGQAMHAVIAFAAWLKRNNAELTLSEMPAVAENLAKHLDPARDPSDMTRGVIGSRLAQLVWIDQLWVEAHLDALFPPDSPSLRTTTFDTFLAWGRASALLLRVLSREYACAVDDLPMPDERRSKIAKKPGFALAEHLAVYLWHGRLDTAPDGLVAKFANNAPADELAHMVSFLGRTMDTLDEATRSELDPGVYERLIAAWDLVHDQATTRTPEERNEILAPFGWWYGAGLLDPEWSDTELLKLLRTGVAVDPDFRVGRELAVRATQNLPVALEIVHEYLRAPGPYWSLYAMRDAFRLTLSLAVKSPQEDVRGDARQLVHELGQRGMGEFRDLLGDSHFDDAH